MNRTKSNKHLNLRAINFKNSSYEFTYKISVTKVDAL